MHDFRHSFAIHLFEGGTDLRVYPRNSEHKGSKTPEIYTRVNTKNLGKIKSPLDGLKLKKGGGE